MLPRSLPFLLCQCDRTLANLHGKKGKEGDWLVCVCRWSAYPGQPKGGGVWTEQKWKEKLESNSKGRLCFGMLGWRWNLFPCKLLFCNKEKIIFFPHSLTAWSSTVCLRLESSPLKESYFKTRQAWAETGHCQSCSWTQLFWYNIETVCKEDSYPECFFSFQSPTPGFI